MADPSVRIDSYELRLLCQGDGFLGNSFFTSNDLLSAEKSSKMCTLNHLRQIFSFVFFIHLTIVQTFTVNSQIFFSNRLFWPDPALQEWPIS